MRYSTPLIAAMLFAVLASPGVAGPHFDFKACPLPAGREATLAQAIKTCRNTIVFVHRLVSEEQVSAYYALGQLLHFDRQYDEAIENYSMAIDIWHQSSELYLARGDAYTALGKTDLAKQDYESAKALNEDTPVQAKARCSLRALRGGPYDLALSDCDAALAADPRDAHVLFARGLARYRSGDDAHAIADLDASLALRPANPGALLVRGFAKQHAKDAAGAEADLAAAQKILPGIAASYAVLGIGPQ